MKEPHEMENELTSKHVSRISEQQKWLKTNNSSHSVENLENGTLCNGLLKLTRKVEDILTTAFTLRSIVIKKPFTAGDGWVFPTKCRPVSGEESVPFEEVVDEGWSENAKR